LYCNQLWKELVGKYVVDQALVEKAEEKGTQFKGHYYDTGLRS